MSLFRPRHTISSVVQQLRSGLLNGNITLSPTSAKTILESKSPALRSTAESPINKFDPDSFAQGSATVPEKAGGLGDNVTVLLQKWRLGDKAAESQLFQLLMPDLKRIAARSLRRERLGHGLEPSDLVSECFLRLKTANANIEWRDQSHFLAIVTLKMQRILIDYARKKHDSQEVPLEDLPERALANNNWLEIALTLDELLDQLEKDSPLDYTVVVLRIHLGMSNQEIAASLRMSLRAVERVWHQARKQLYTQLNLARASVRAKEDPDVSLTNDRIFHKFVVEYELAEF